MFDLVKNMYRKSVDAVMAIGRSLKEKVIEGEYLGKGGLVVVGTAVSTSSFAAVPAGVTTAITDAATDVATIGAAVILVYVGIKVFKWIRGAL